MDSMNSQAFSTATLVDANAAALAAQGSVSLAPAAATAASNALHHIGFVMEIAGSGSQITLDAARLNDLVAHSDPSIAMAGQVGSQIKIRVGGTWLLASIRTQRMHENDHGVIMAAVDFLGEGD